MVDASVQRVVSIVEGLTDSQSVALLKQVNQMIFKALPVQEIGLKVHRSDESAGYLLSLDADAKRRELSSPEAIVVAKGLLKTLAGDKNLASVVEAAWKEISAVNTLSVVDVIIPLGLLVNLALLMATTELKFKIGNLEIKKGKASAALLKELLQPVIELIRKTPH